MRNLLTIILVFVLSGCCWTRKYHKSGKIKESRIEVYAPIRLENVSGVTLTIGE